MENVVKSQLNEEMNPLQKELSSRSNANGQQSVGGLSSSLNNNLNGSSYQPNMFANKMFMEMQRRMYASAMGQQNQQQNQQQNGRNEEESNASVRNAVMKDIIRFVQTLNEKFLTVSLIFGFKIITHRFQMSNEFSLTETEKALNQQLKQQKEKQDWRGLPSFGLPNVGAPNLGAMNPLFNPLNLPYTNPRQLLAMSANQSPLHSIANSMAQQNSTSNSTANSNMSFANLVNNSSNSNNKLPNSSSGIFPTAVPNFPPFNGFVNHTAANNLAKIDE